MGRSTRRKPSRSDDQGGKASVPPAAGARAGRSGGNKFGRIAVGFAVVIVLGVVGVWTLRTQDSIAPATVPNDLVTQSPPNTANPANNDGVRDFPTVIIPDDLEALDPQIRAYVTEYIRRAKQDPTDLDRHVTLGQVYFANGRWKEALACFEKVRAKRPDSVMPAYYAAVATFKMGEQNQYKRMLQDLSQRDGSFAPAHYRLGIVYLEEGATDEAGVSFQRAIDHAARSPAGYVGMADVKIRQREYAEAERLLQKAFELKTRDQKAHYLLGLAYRGLGRLEKAKRALEKGSGATKRFMPDPWTAQLNQHRRGIAYQVRTAEKYLKAERPEKAIEVLEVALQWHPDNVEVLNNLAIAHLGLQQFEKALSLLTRAESIGNNATATSINLAACHLGLGSFQQAIQYADRAIELGPTVAQAYLTKARILLRMGQSDEAVAMLEQVIRLDQDNDAVRFDLANAYMARDRPADAKEHYTALAKRVPASIQAHLRLCEACIRLGDWEEAESALASAQRIAPNHQLVIRMTDRLERLRP